MGGHTKHHDPGSITDHPEDVNPLGDTHATFTPEERRTLLILAIGFIGTIIAVPILAVMTLSPMTNVFLVFSPLMLTLIVDMVVVAQHFKRVVLWLILVVMHVVGMGALYFVNALLLTPMHVEQGVVLSFFFGAGVTFLAYLSDAHQVVKHVYKRPPPAQFSLERLPELVQEIADKAKALNLAVSRVYKAGNGGTSSMRQRLRIPREWYIEFVGCHEHERVKHAGLLVSKIHDRLLVFRKKEKDVYSKEELQRLKHLKRNENGNSTIIHVLNANDTDPVDAYYRSAMHVCEKVLRGLAKT